MIRTFQLGAMAALAAASLALAADASAQTPARATPAASVDASVQTGIRTQSSMTTPGTFSGPRRIEGANVTTGSAPSAERGPAGEIRGSNTPAPDEISGPIGAGDAARLIRARMSQLRPCYERARAARPTLMGRVELRWTIAANGSVLQAAAAGMPDAPEVATCLRDVLRQMTFPQPSSAPLVMVYPLTFAPEPMPANTRGQARTRPATPSRAVTRPAASNRR